MNKIRFYFISYKYMGVGEEKNLFIYVYILVVIMYVIHTYYIYALERVWIRGIYSHGRACACGTWWCCGVKRTGLTRLCKIKIFFSKNFHAFSKPAFLDRKVDRM